MATKLVRDLRNALRPFAGRTTATDLARDLAEAFRLEFPPVDPDTKYANALARGIPALRKLLRAEGGSLSELEVQAKLGVSQAVLLKLVKKRQIVAWHQGEALRFPAWQFGAGRVLPGVAEALQVLPADENGAVLFFLSKFGHIGKRPLDCLRSGETGLVLQAARSWTQ